MEKILEVLEQIRPDVEFAKEKSLIDDGVLDSFDIIQVVMALNEAYDIEINVEELEPENFNSVEAMLALVNKLQAE